MNNTIKKILLKPLSAIYGAGVATWNKMYDLGILRSKEGAIPTISVGNITVGGTGKTPHTEYLLSLLSKKIKTAYVSRGYKRQTKGFQLASEDSDASQIGDEAFQVKNKFTNVTVAVDADRHNALNRLSRLDDKPKVAIMDDAYQHRKLKPDFSILLIDSNRLTYNDSMLPYGRLRESHKNTDRADVIIITKCGEDFKPVDSMTIKSHIRPYPYQSIYFTKIGYCTPKYLFSDSTADLTGKDILLVTGIAQPQHLLLHLKKYSKNISHLSFPDHHNFSHKDINYISSEFDKLNEKNRIIVTTEKDASRFLDSELSEKIKNNICHIDITIGFLYDGESKFNSEIEKFLCSHHICNKN